MKKIRKATKGGPRARFDAQAGTFAITGNIVALSGAKSVKGVGHTATVRIQNKGANGTLYLDNLSADVFQALTEGQRISITFSRP